MTDADRVRTETDKMEARFSAPDNIDALAAAREHSAAQLRFIAKAFEKMEEGSKRVDAERTGKH
jgi:hypothetical protein